MREAKQRAIVSYARCFSAVADAVRSADERSGLGRDVYIGTTLISQSFFTCLAERCTLDRAGLLIIQMILWC
jgi:hypothetical protein